MLNVRIIISTWNGRLTTRHFLLNAYRLAEEDFPAKLTRQVAVPALLRCRTHDR